MLAQSARRFSLIHIRKRVLTVPRRARTLFKIQRQDNTVGNLEREIRRPRFVSPSTRPALFLPHRLSNRAYFSYRREFNVVDRNTLNAYLTVKKLPRDSAEVIVEQPVEKRIPEAVGESQPRGQEVEERRWLASGAGCNDFLDRPRRDHDDETQTHCSHCSRGRGRQSSLVGDKLKYVRHLYYV